MSESMAKSLMDNNNNNKLATASAERAAHARRAWEHATGLVAFYTSVLGTMCIATNLNVSIVMAWCVCPSDG